MDPMTRCNATPVPDTLTADPTSNYALLAIPLAILLLIRFNFPCVSTSGDCTHL